MDNGKEIIAVCAVPPGVNPGMSSVDLALKLLLEKHHLLNEVDFYTLYSVPSDPVLKPPPIRLPIP